MQWVVASHLGNRLALVAELVAVAVEGTLGRCFQGSTRAWGSASRAAVGNADRCFLLNTVSALLINFVFHIQHHREDSKKNAFG